MSCTFLFSVDNLNICRSFKDIFAVYLSVYVFALQWFTTFYSENVILIKQPLLPTIFKTFHASKNLVKSYFPTDFVLFFGKRNTKKFTYFFYF